MVILPCSMGTLAAIANGLAANLIQRAADVCLKENRPLILCVRETPFNRIHLRNMQLASDAGATIFPAIPTLYNHPQTTRTWPANSSTASSPTSACPNPAPTNGNPTSRSQPRQNPCHHVKTSCEAFRHRAAKRPLPTPHRRFRLKKLHRPLHHRLERTPPEPDARNPPQHSAPTAARSYESSRRQTAESGHPARPTQSASAADIRAAENPTDRVPLVIAAMLRWITHAFPAASAAQLQPQSPAAVAASASASRSASSPRPHQPA